MVLNFKFNPLRQGHFAAPANGAGLAAHIGLPCIGAGFAAAAGLFFSAEGAPDFGAGNCVDGPAAVENFCAFIQMFMGYSS